MQTMDHALGLFILWLKIVQDEGPKHGYFNETSKNIVIVAPQFKEQAQAFFQEFGIQVLTGHRF